MSRFISLFCDFASEREREREKDREGEISRGRKIEGEKDRDRERCHALLAARKRNATTEQTKNNVYNKSNLHLIPRNAWCQEVPRSQNIKNIKKNKI